MRLAPSLEIIQPLVRDGAIIRTYDPQAMDKAREILPDLQYCADPYEAATGAEALVICTEWEEFRSLDLDRLKSVMAQPIVLDGRNLFNPSELTSRGFTYYGVGRNVDHGR